MNNRSLLPANMIAALFRAEECFFFYFIAEEGWDAIETMPLASHTRPHKQH